jgi:hypothetical protein
MRKVCLLGWLVACLNNNFRNAPTNLAQNFALTYIRSKIYLLKLKRPGVLFSVFLMQLLQNDFAFFVISNYIGTMKKLQGTRGPL